MIFIPSRNTAQRQIVLDTIMRMNNHPSAGQVYDELHDEYPSISRSTVFRLLDKESQVNRLARLKLPGVEDRFDLNCAPHSHFVCRTCHRVFDIPVEIDEHVMEKLPKHLEFDVEGYNCSFFGVCGDCKE